MTDDLITIREMCDTFEVTPRTLRFYESRELLFPQRRGQHRLYDRHDRGRLKLILRGKRFGMSLEEIRQLLELYNPGESNETQLSATLDAARERLSALERQRADLDLVIDDLRGQLGVVENMLEDARRRT